MKNWYIVQTFSGFEQKVATTIKETIQSKDLGEKIENVLVPMHEVTIVQKGKRVQKKKKYFPSYVLVKMEMNKELYHMIKNIQKVTGFLGTTGNPVPVPEKEIDWMFSSEEVRRKISSIPISHENVIEYSLQRVNTGVHEAMSSLENVKPGINDRFFSQ